MLVDAYDAQGIPAALGTSEFHAACRDALTAEGVLATNLYCDDHAAHFGRLRRAFDGQALLVEEPRQSNRVGFAWKGGARPREVEPVLESMPPVAAAQLRRSFRRVAAATKRAGAIPA